MTFTDCAARSAGLRPPRAAAASMDAMDFARLDGLLPAAVHRGMTASLFLLLFWFWFVVLLSVRSIAQIGVCVEPCSTRGLQTCEAAVQGIFLRGHLESALSCLELRHFNSCQICSRGIFGADISRALYTSTACPRPLLCQDYQCRNLP